MQSYGAFLAESDYDTFLATKHLRDIPTGIDVPLDNISPALFDWQQQLVRWALKRGRAAIFAGTGLGKTIQQLEWAQHVPGNVLIFAPLGVTHQTIAEAKHKLGMDVDYVRRPGELCRKVSITNYDLLEHFCDVNVNGIVLDECFPAGTMVETVDGKRAIEEIIEGDKIYNFYGEDTVVATKSREIATLVEVGLSNGEKVFCSENHPFFSRDGIIHGSNLKSGDLLYGSAFVRGMRERYFPQTKEESFLRSELLSFLAHEKPGNTCKSSQRYCPQKGSRVSEEILCIRFGKSGGNEGSYSLIKSNIRPECESKDIYNPSEDSPQTSSAGGEWEANAVATKNPSGITRGSVGCRVCNISREENGRISYLLQSGSWESIINDCHRDRRIQSCGGETKIFRHEEGRQAQFIRVESVAIHQQGSPQFRARSGGKSTVTCYDLQVDNHPSYSVAGVMVHNSSCLKGITSKRRKLLFDHFTHIPFRLCCTATPAPNDIAEMAMHAQFLGVMKREDMLATFFVHDESSWRIMDHAKEHFYKWLASWSMALRNPEDLGYDGTDFLLPPLSLEEHFLPWDDARLIADAEGQLSIAGTQKLHGIGDRIAVRQQTVRLRAEYAAEMVKESLCNIQNKWVIWCGLDEEQNLIAKLLGDQCVSIYGSLPPEEKLRREKLWREGDIPVIVTKAKIFGWGVNWQHCSNAIFLGMNDSLELFFQTVRRLWRYGQQHPVTTHIVLSEHERPIWENVQRKEKEANTMIDGLIEAVKTYEQEELGVKAAVGIDNAIIAHEGDDWRVLHGDCVEGLKQIPDESVSLSIFSPPFLSLFQYNASERDLGNCMSTEQFFEHHHYVTDQLLRILRPGRLIAMHMSQVPAMLVRDGWIGLKDFRGDMTRHMVEHGFTYAGEVTCGKSPQAQAIRIRAKGLAFNQLHKDSAWSRPCLGDYIVLYRKPGENVVPVIPDIDNNTWILWASNIWYSTYYDKENGYRETYTLNVSEGRDEKDTKHICPLPLDLVERCVRLWSNSGETILDPFSGLGTTGVKALEHNRQYIGCELKESYVAAQLKNLERATRRATQQTLL